MDGVRQKGMLIALLRDTHHLIYYILHELHLRFYYLIMHLIS